MLNGAELASDDNCIHKFYSNAQPVNQKIFPYWRCCHCIQVMQLFTVCEQLPVSLDYIMTIVCPNAEGKTPNWQMELSCTMLKQLYWYFQVDFRSNCLKLALNFLIAFYKLALQVISTFCRTLPCTQTFRYLLTVFFSIRACSSHLKSMLRHGTSTHTALQPPHSSGVSHVFSHTLTA